MFPSMNATSEVLASGVDIDVKAIAMPSLYSAIELSDAATMPTEIEKLQNATTVNNANPNVFLASRPTQTNRSAFGAGRGRGLIVPNQGSTTSNVQNRTNG
jgi:hypothetical protein